MRITSAVVYDALLRSKESVHTASLLQQIVAAENIDGIADLVRDPENRRLLGLSADDDVVVVLGVGNDELPSAERLADLSSDETSSSYDILHAVASHVLKQQQEKDLIDVDPNVISLPKTVIDFAKQCFTDVGQLQGLEKVFDSYQAQAQRLSQCKTPADAMSELLYITASSANIRDRLSQRGTVLQDEINSLPADDAERKNLQDKLNRLNVAIDAVRLQKDFFDKAQKYYLALTAEEREEVVTQEKRNAAITAYSTISIDWATWIATELSKKEQPQSPAPKDEEENAPSYDSIVSAVPINSEEGFKDAIEVLRKLPDDFAVADEKKEQGDSSTAFSITCKQIPGENKVTVTYVPPADASSAAQLRARGSCEAIVAAYAALFKAALQKQGILDEKGQPTEGNGNYRLCFNPDAVTLTCGGNPAGAKERQEFNAAFTAEFQRVFGGVYQTGAKKGSLDAKVHLPPPTQAWRRDSLREEKESAAPEGEGPATPTPRP